MSPGARRTLAAATYWLLVAPGAVWALVRGLGLDRGSPAVELVSFTPYVALGSLVVLAVVLIERRWWEAGVAAAVSVALLAGVVPRTVGGPTDATGVELRVMAANLRVGGADASAVVDLVRRHRVDVLTIQELTAEAERRLVAAGLETLLPHSHRSPADGVVGSAVFSRHPLTDATTRRNPGNFRQVVATVLVPGAAPVPVESVHPVPPSPRDRIDLWAAGLRGQTPASPDGAPRILAGDFNATLDHAELRRLIGTGYRDAASAVGLGLTPTWPYDGRLHGLAPPVAIDHILVDRRIGVRDFAAYKVPNTDHRAIIATLVLPAPS